MRLFAAFLFLLLTTIFIFHYVHAESVLVEVEQGILAGEKLQTILRDMSYYSFKGIPYAKPPVGSLRFMAPEPPLPWEGIKNATEHGAICPQINDLTKLYSPGSEDCLFLNVYTPNITTDSPLPVIFYIHGGVYRFGSGNDDGLGPDYLVEKGVVLVTINYRLDVLGFLSLGNKEVPGNMGLKDQVAAMKWVKNNIGKFGGNPDMITIFGNSAGGASVILHMISPMSKGYFQRAIAMSGSPKCDWSTSFLPTRRAFMLGQILGYETRNKSDLLSFLQNVPYATLIEANPTVLASENITSNLITLQPFAPVYEEDFGQDVFLSDDPATLLKTNQFTNVDFMTGYCNIETVTILSEFEASLLSLYKRYIEQLVPSKILIKRDPATILKLSDKVREYYFGDQSIDDTTMREFIYLTSNSTFAIEVQSILRNLPNLENKSRYFYKFSANTKLNFFAAAAAKYNMYGTGHTDDLFYLFSTKGFGLTVEKDSVEYEMVDKVTTLFTNFVKYGNPTPDSSLGIQWPLFDNNTLPYLDIGNTLTTSTKPDEEDWQFWKGIYQDAEIDI